QINVFELDKRLYLVDLPGYGFAAVSQRMRASWDMLIMSYLRERSTLRRVFLLIDSRHGFKKSDCALMNLLDAAAVVYQCVFTKSDEATEDERQRNQKMFADETSRHSAIFPTCLETSTVKRTGLKEVQCAIHACC
ncbi:MAG: YihA family ribosome biogenesis GTP-binding protein, partial [Holosporales bacterium]|nr:YihA family ribosome biogenesis GTP-binding protein [Holosporales bacterium]